MKVQVLGSTGIIGKKLLELNETQSEYTFVGCSRAEFDPVSIVYSSFCSSRNPLALNKCQLESFVNSNHEKFIQEIKNACNVIKQGFDLTINCMVCKDESKVFEMYLINQYLPMILGNISKSQSYPVIHMSTNYVFNSRHLLRNISSYLPSYSDELHTKEGLESHYARSKRLGESLFFSAINHNPSQGYIIRVQDIGITQLRSKLQEDLMLGKEIKIREDKLIQPTTPEFIAQEILHMLNNIQSGVQEEIFNCYPKDELPVLTGEYLREGMEKEFAERFSIREYSEGQLWSIYNRK